MRRGTRTQTRKEARSERIDAICMVVSRCIWRDDQVGGGRSKKRIGGYQLVCRQGREGVVDLTPHEDEPTSTGNCRFLRTNSLSLATYFFPSPVCFRYIIYSSHPN